MKNMSRITIAAAAALLILTGAANANAQEAANPAGTAVYALPQTTVTLAVTAEKETFLAGPYAQYAKKYLGDEAQAEDAVTYSIKSIDLVPYIEADMSNTYTTTLSGKDLSSSIFLQMCSQGLVAMSDSYTGKAGAWRFPSIAANDRFDGKDPKGNLTTSTTTLYKSVNTGDGFRKVAVQQSEVIEKSLEKKAAEAAQTIFNLRKSRIQIITGDTDATFSGEALKAAVDEMTRLEQEYMTLFYGIRETSVQRMNFDVTPTAANGKQMYVAFRISTTDGLLPASDVIGRPVVLQLIPDSVRPEMSAAAQAKSGAKKQIMYRIPATATAKVIDGEQLLLQTRIPVYQLGTTCSISF